MKQRNSVFNVTSEKKSFSITIPGYWQPKSAEKTVDELSKLLELKFKKGIELHVNENRERGNQIKMEDNEYNLSDLDTQEKRDTWRITKM